MIVGDSKEINQRQTAALQHKGEAKLRDEATTPPDRRDRQEREDARRWTKEEIERLHAERRRIREERLRLAVEEGVRLRMQDDGFFLATVISRCGLCIERGETLANSQILPGSWVRTMPKKWSPKRRSRLAHHGCVLDLIARIRKETGLRVTL